MLVVDDEPFFLEVVQDSLELLVYRVTTNQCSLKTLETFKENPDGYALLITDQTMPGITGINLAGRMLQIRPNIPIILCTGFSNLVNEESAKVIGIREFALKPLTSSSIGHLVKKLLDGNGERVV